MSNQRKSNGSSDYNYNHAKSHVNNKDIAQRSGQLAEDCYKNGLSCVIVISKNTEQRNEGDKLITNATGCANVAFPTSSTADDLSPNVHPEHRNQIERMTNDDVENEMITLIVNFIESVEECVGEEVFVDVLSKALKNHAERKRANLIAKIEMGKIGIGEFGVLEDILNSPMGDSLRGILDGLRGDK